MQDVDDSQDSVRELEEVKVAKANTVPKINDIQSDNLKNLMEAELVARAVKKKNQAHSNNALHYLGFGKKSLYDSY